jgi:hypothetical protein
MIQVRYKASGTAEFQDIGQIVAYDPYNRTANFNPWQQVSGPDIDYKRIEKLIAKGIEAIVIPEAKEQKPVDLSPVTNGILRLAQRIEAIQIPEAKEVDLTPISEGLQAILTEVRAIEMPEIPEQKETDLSPVLERIEELKGNIKDPAEVASLLREVVEKLSDAPERLTTVLEQIEDALDMKKMRDAFTTMNAKPAPEEKKPDSIRNHIKLV